MGVELASRVASSLRSLTRCANYSSQSFDIASHFSGRSLAFALVGTRSFHASHASKSNVERGGDDLIKPHGGQLVSTMVEDKRKDSILREVTKTIECSDRNACDVELIINGGFSPLRGFMSKKEFDSVVDNMKLTDGSTFGLPVVMDTHDPNVKPGDKVALKYQNKPIAVMHVEDAWEADKLRETKECYGYYSLDHPAVGMAAMERGAYYLGGQVEGIQYPERIFPCKTPADLRRELPAGKDVVAFQCRNPVHRAHYEIFKRSLQSENVGKDAVCLVHPTCGPTQDEDIPGIVRYHTYEALQKELDDPAVMWAYLPYSMHMAGPREAVQHMIIRKNYGCTHFIVGRDMAGCKSRIDDEDFYGPFDAQQMAQKYASTLGMEVVPSPNVVYTEEKGYTSDEVAKKENLTVKKISGTKFRQMLRNDEPIPEWFSFDSVINALKQHYVQK